MRRPYGMRRITCTDRRHHDPMLDDPQSRPVSPAPVAARPTKLAEDLVRGDEIKLPDGRWTSVSSVFVQPHGVRVVVAGLRLQWFLRGQRVEVRRVA